MTTLPFVYVQGRHNYVIIVLFPTDFGGCLRNSEDKAPGRCFLLVTPGLDKLIAELGRLRPGKQKSLAQGHTVSW